jgi:hypothetical protein
VIYRVPLTVINADERSREASAASASFKVAFWTVTSKKRAPQRQEREVTSVEIRM